MCQRDAQHQAQLWAKASRWPLSGATTRNRKATGTTAPNSRPAAGQERPHARQEQQQEHGSPQARPEGAADDLRHSQRPHRVEVKQGDDIRAGGVQQADHWWKVSIASAPARETPADVAHVDWVRSGHANGFTIDAEQAGAMLHVFGQQLAAASGGSRLQDQRIPDRADAGDAGQWRRG